jgi:hypothetical protein
MKNKNSKQSNLNKQELEPEVTELMGLPPDEAPSQIDKNEKAVISAPLLEDIESDDKENAIETQDKQDYSLEIQNQELSESTKPNDEFSKDEISEPEPLDNLSDDKTIDTTIADIVASDSDELLAKKDQETETLNTEITVKKNKFPNIFKLWWNHKKIRTTSIVILIIAILGIIIYPTTRYFVLNIAGVRASMTVSVIDQKYGKPIKNVEVTAGGKSGLTGDEGEVTIYGLKLGSTTMIVKKRSFATIEKNIVVGWGSNPFNDPIQLDSVGSNYSFIFTDWLSGAPIAKAELTDGESTVVSGDDGKVDFITEPTDKDINFTISASSYRNENLVVSADTTSEQAVKLVLAKPNIFVSKRSGKYDVFKRDVDGKNETTLLSGTGTEQEDISILQNMNSDKVAFVSSREGKRNKEGYLLSNLYIIDSTTKSVSKIDDTESEKIQLLGWINDRLIFVQVISGPSATTTNRQRIISYNEKDDSKTELVGANYFNDVELINGQIYYAPSGGLLYKISADGSGQSTILNKETWTIYRSDYDTLQLSASDNKWYQLSLLDNKIINLSGPPAIQKYKLFVDNKSLTRTIWIDNRDGKGTMLLSDPKDFKTEKILQQTGGLNYPAYWFTDEHLVYRVSNSTETADYIINVKGGDPARIGDVTNTSSTSRWYYYQ